MAESKLALLPDRGVVSVEGPDAAKLLQGVITNDMDLIAQQGALHAGLLSPQGKILFEFFVVKGPDGFCLETARAKAAELAERLKMYKLRADVAIKDASADYTVAAIWGAVGEHAPEGTGPAPLRFADPRLAALGLRELTTLRSDWALGGEDAQSATQEEYHAYRIGLGVPEGGKDYAFGDAFPHEALFDQLHGVSFEKGCYVGQEVVIAHAESRHGAAAHSSARRRLATSRERCLDRRRRCRNRHARLGRRRPRPGADPPRPRRRVHRQGRNPARRRRARACRHPRLGALQVGSQTRGLQRMSRATDAKIVRCTWAGSDAEYQRYHDEEWGVPLKTDRAIFEKLVLEGFQAGLSWITILRKRENFRRAFDRFDPQRIAKYGAKDFARLMADEGIVRNRAKIEATIDNAKALSAAARAHDPQDVPRRLSRR